jgi:hypothetical protein
MDEMGSERMRLANLLMETLDSIEQESGIFLIKPMYSYRGRSVEFLLLLQGEVSGISADVLHLYLNIWHSNFCPFIRKTITKNSKD